ncbi:MAG: hypothetical protein EA400_00480 [Chromatiaceae bacterium]|nr:MAG: hypothetical protein EA400_00480 [Chromatiaceae bacterium]
MCCATSRRAAWSSGRAWRSASAPWVSGRRPTKSTRTPSTSAAGSTRWATSWRRCRSPYKARPRPTCRRVFLADTQQAARRALDRFVAGYQAKYPKATEKLLHDRDALLAYYDFPAEHWGHLRTTNPIESTFATLRHRTRQTKNCITTASSAGPRPITSHVSAPLRA